MIKATNKPVVFIGYSPDGTKEYVGDFQPQGLNRQQRRQYLQKSTRPEYGLPKDCYHIQRVYNAKQERFVRIVHRISKTKPQ